METSQRGSFDNEMIELALFYQSRRWAPCGMSSVFADRTVSHRAASNRNIRQPLSLASSSEESSLDELLRFPDPGHRGQTLNRARVLFSTLFDFSSQDYRVCIRLGSRDLLASKLRLQPAREAFADSFLSGHASRLISPRSGDYRSKVSREALQTLALRRSPAFRFRGNTAVGVRAKLLWRNFISPL